MRVVSLLPSATEIVAGLGAMNQLVGRSEECDFPPAVRQLPVVMRANHDYSGSASKEIDEYVQRARSAGRWLYTLDIPVLRDLRPDVILTQDLCGVCSVTDEEVASACDAAGVQPEIVSLSPRTLEDVWDSVLAVGRAIQKPREALDLVALLRRGEAPARASPGPRVAVVEWLDPPILAGLWVPDMVAAAGGVPVGPASGEPGRRTRWEDLGGAALDLVVVSPCSFPVGRTVGELDSMRGSDLLRRRSPPRGLWVADEAFFSRPGPRLAHGVDLLRRLACGASPSDLPLPVVRWTTPGAPHAT